MESWQVMALGIIWLGAAAMVLPHLPYIVWGFQHLTSRKKD
jgi:hypothetical protein